MRSVMRRRSIPDGRVHFRRQTGAEPGWRAAGAESTLCHAADEDRASMVAELFWVSRRLSDEELAAWGSAIFRYLFTDLTNEPAVSKRQRQRPPRWGTRLDRTIADRKANPDENDNVLNRCLALQKAGVPGMDDLGVGCSLLGLLTGAIPTTSKCCTQALDELLKRPDALEGAHRAALADDDALLRVLRFRRGDDPIRTSLAFSARRCRRVCGRKRNPARRRKFPREPLVLPQPGERCCRRVPRGSASRIRGKIAPPYLELRHAHSLPGNTSIACRFPAF